MTLRAPTITSLGEPGTVLNLDFVPGGVGPAAHPDNINYGDWCRYPACRRTSLIRSARLPVSTKFPGSVLGCRQRSSLRRTADTQLRKPEIRLESTDPAKAGPNACKRPPIAAVGSLGRPSAALEDQTVSNAARTQSCSCLRQSLKTPLGNRADLQRRSGVRGADWVSPQQTRVEMSFRRP